MSVGDEGSEVVGDVVVWPGPGRFEGLIAVGGDLTGEGGVVEVLELGSGGCGVV